MGVMPFHQRLAEIWTAHSKNLSEAEMLEISQCLTLNAKWCWEMAYHENLSLMASMVHDVDWQHEICLDIEELERYGKIKKKPDPKEPGKE